MQMLILLQIDKYENNAFGTCPRVHCRSTNVVPCGRSDVPGYDTVKLYCPNCNDIYAPPSSRYQGVDGAFFGTTFAHLFFQSYRELAPAPFYKPLLSSGGSSPKSGTSGSGGGTAFVNPNPHGGQKRAEGGVYTPKIYGFKVSERAKSGPRMKWLRLRPEAPEELDKVDWRGRWLDADFSDEDDEDDEDGREMEMEEFDPVCIVLLSGLPFCLSFSQDVNYDDDDDEEEEEEEEEMQGGQSYAGGRRVMELVAQHAQSARTSPTGAGLRPPKETPKVPAPAHVPIRLGLPTGQVRIVRQYVPAAA